MQLFSIPQSQYCFIQYLLTKKTKVFFNVLTSGEIYEVVRVYIYLGYKSILVYGQTL